MSLTKEPNLTMRPCPEGCNCQRPLSGKKCVMLEIKKEITTMNCWEFKGCGMEKDGINASKRGVCPAWPNNGQKCARIAGTLCDGKVQGIFALKLKDCMCCDFYRSQHYKRV